MPPRYAYWTILVDNQPTAFRAAMQEDLMPTFKRLKEKHPSAEMKWFQNGKLWASRDEAHEAMLNRGERGRMGDKRQGGGFRDRKRSVGENFSSPEGEREKPRGPGEKLEWKPKGEFTPAPKRERSSRPQDFKTSRPERGSEWKTSRPQGFEQSRPPRRDPDEKLEWKPKGEFTPAPKRADRADRSERADWKPKPFDGDRKPEWKRKPSGFAAEGRESRGSAQREGGKPEWKPKGEFTPAPKRDRSSRPQNFKTSRSEGRREWKPKGSFDRDRKPEWKRKPSGFAAEDRESRRSAPREGGKPDWRAKSERPKWTPKGERTSGSRFPAPGSRFPAPGSREMPGEGGPPKRKWIPKEEYKKSKGIEAKRDSKWRPGGEHRDPRQKYKDAKKAKWQGFKKNIRTRWEAKNKKKS